MLLFMGCTPKSGEHRVGGETGPSIGSARMNEDGTLILSLRPEAVGGREGDVRMALPPNHEKYDAYMKHLGGMRPGESKLLRSWPDGEPRPGA